MKPKVQPKFITIIRPWSEISWFNHLIGETFEVISISSHNFAQIEYKDGFKGWVPLVCCIKRFFKHLPKVTGTTAPHSEAEAVEGL